VRLEGVIQDRLDRDVGLEVSAVHGEVDQAPTPFPRMGASN
jgi:hypothetical protein